MRKLINNCKIEKGVIIIRTFAENKNLNDKCSVCGHPWIDHIYQKDKYLKKCSHRLKGYKYSFDKCMTEICASCGHSFKDHGGNYLSKKKKIKKNTKKVKGYPGTVVGCFFSSKMMSFPRI